MTFLTLAQRLRQEAGIAGAGPTTVISQAGELGRVVDWISTAYQYIQNLHNTWLFLRDDFSFSTISGTQNYTKTALSLTSLSSWKIDDIRLYSSVSDEQYLPHFSWSEFKSLYMFGSSRTQSGRPTLFSIKPDHSISLWPIPDAVYTCNGEYFKIAQTMTADSDEPVIPADYQLAIVWKALMYYGAYSGAVDSYTHGQNEFESILRKLEGNQLPQLSWGNPLA